jgi:hypothetical protein
MSTEDRLARLGLSHLKDKPEELEKELAKRLAEQRKEDERWHEEQKQIRAKKKK